jgi:hypothetical protein
VRDLISEMVACTKSNTSDERTRKHAKQFVIKVNLSNR